MHQRNLNYFMSFLLLHPGHLSDLCSKTSPYQSAFLSPLSLSGSSWGLLTNVSSDSESYEQALGTSQEISAFCLAPHAPRSWLLGFQQLHLPCPLPTHIPFPQSNYGVPRGPSCWWSPNFFHGHIPMVGCGLDTNSKNTQRLAQNIDTRTHSQRNMHTHQGSPNLSQSRRFTILQ